LFNTQCNFLAISASYFCDVPVKVASTAFVDPGYHAATLRWTATSESPEVFTRQALLKAKRGALASTMQAHPSRHPKDYRKQLVEGGFIVDILLLKRAA
jgi:hypothetical protein